MEGRSLLPAFENKAIERDALFWEHESNAAVRVGDMKLVRFGRNGAWELYDMKADRTEQHDLAATMPDKAKELAEKWEEWAVRANARRFRFNRPANAPSLHRAGTVKTNVVQASPDSPRITSPPCARASSRARLRPRP